MAQTQTRMKCEREQKAEKKGNERKNEEEKSTMKKNINLHNVSADAPVF